MKNKLRLATFEITNACMEKLEFKEKQGYGGWNDSNYENSMKEDLKKHFKKEWTQENLIDISNFCNFLWNLIEKKKHIPY